MRLGKAFAVGGVDYITKPFQVEEVLARVEHQLNLRRLQDQLMNALAQEQALNQRIEELATLEERNRCTSYPKWLTNVEKLEIRVK